MQQETSETVHMVSHVVPSTTMATSPSLEQLLLTSSSMSLSALFGRATENPSGFFSDVLLFDQRCRYGCDSVSSDVFAYQRLQVAGQRCC